jgi:hypothetical protein
MIVLSNLEVKFLQQLTGLDVPVNEPYQELVNGPPSTPSFDRILKEMASGIQEDLAFSAASAYRSLLGFYNGKLSKLGHPGVDVLINFANVFVKQTGWKTLPEIEMQTIKKMGLRNYVGLNVVYKIADKPGRGDGRGGGRGGGGRGAGRGNGGGSARYMSTTSQPSTVPLKRAIVSGGSNRDQVGNVANNSFKKPKSDTVNTDEGTGEAKKNRRRRPAGRGGRDGPSIM